MAANLTDVGIAKYQNAVNGGSHTPPQHVGWGEDGSGLDPTNTDLEDAVDQPRVSGTKSLETENVTDDTYQVISTLTAGGTLAIEEAGLFDGAGSGNPPAGANMYVRGVFSTINLEEDDSVQFTFRITLEQPA
jgi:hypothetical protein